MLTRQRERGETAELRQEIIRNDEVEASTFQRGQPFGPSLDAPDLAAEPRLVQQCAQEFRIRSIILDMQGPSPAPHGWSVPWQLKGAGSGRV